MRPSIPLKDSGELSVTAPLSHLREYYHFRIFYLYTQLDYLLASKGKGPWDKEEVEKQLAHAKKQLEELYDY